MISILRSGPWMLHIKMSRSFCSTSGVFRKYLKSAGQLQQKRVKDMGDLLRPFREPDTAEIDQMSSHDAEVDMYLQERISQAVKSEYQSAKALMNRALARRSVQRGPQQPGVLTAAQKLELRRLAAEDPHHWRPARLATAFSVTTDAARKVLKSRWQPTSPEEIRRHDRKTAARRKALGLPAPLIDNLPASPPVQEAPRPPAH